MTSCIGFLISMFGTQMCGQTLLFIVIANCAIVRIILGNTMRINMSTQPAYSDEPLSMHFVLSGYIQHAERYDSHLLNKQLTNHWDVRLYY